MNQNLTNSTQIFFNFVQFILLICQAPTKRFFFFVKGEVGESIERIKNHNTLHNFLFILVKIFFLNQFLFTKLVLAPVRMRGH